MIANPDAVPEPGAVAALHAFIGGAPALRRRRPADGVPRRLVAGLAAQLPDRRRDARPPHAAARRLFPPLEYQRKHYLLDERPTEPVQTDTMLGAFLLLRRTMLAELRGFDPGYRMYCEDIDLNYRAAKAGWERWYVPEAVVVHDYAAVIDHTFLSRHTIWHARAMLRFLRKHPERLLTLR